MNPIENIFGYWHSQVTKHEAQNLEQLIFICRQEWNKISLKMIRNSIKRLLKVMQWVENHNGEFYNV